MMKKLLLSTENVVTREDIHKILMSEVVSSDLNHISPRSDAGILFTIDSSSGEVGDKYFGRKNVCTGLFETILYLTCSDDTKFGYNKITLIEELPSCNKESEISFTCTLSSLYTPMVNLEKEEREALSYLLDKPLDETPQRVSTQKKIPVEDDNALDVLTSRFANKGVVAKLDYISPTVSAHIDRTNKKRIPVRTVSGIMSGEPEDIADLISHGIGKGKNYGLGMIIPEAKE